MSISSFLTKKFLKSLFFPAHNRGAALPKKLVTLLEQQPGYWDLPELPEIGSPLSQSGLIGKIQREFSEKFRTKGCFFSNFTNFLGKAAPLLWAGKKSDFKNFLVRKEEILIKYY